MRPLASLTLLAVTAVAAGSLTPALATPTRESLDVWVPTGDFASSSFARVDRTAPTTPPRAADTDLHALAVRGGHVSGQLAVAGDSAVDDLRVRVSPLVGRDGGRGAIPPSRVQVRYPGYVPDDRGGVIADPLVETDRIDVPAGQAQPVWLTLAVPRKTQPGTYTGRVVVTAHDAEPVTYPLTVEVADVTLPPVSERDFHLNLWFQPDTVADQLGLSLWSDEHFAAMKPYLQDLAEHGQDVVNTAIAQDPWRVQWPDGQWRSQTYVPYNSLVDWARDGSQWSFDFTNWDRFVDESRAAGVGPYIHAFGLLGFRNNFLVYTDSRTGEVVDKQVAVGSLEWKDAWSAFLTAFEDHVRERGLLDVTFMAFDERPAAQMQAAMDLAQEFAPDLAAKGFAGAGSANTDPFTFDLSLNYGDVHDWPQDVIDRRHAEGKFTTFYTWANPPYPNTVTEAAPLGGRVLPWQSAKSGLDGFLRWAYNSWPADPYTDPSYRYRQGDEYLVYPGADGPVSKIGWELFRDGQEDFELLDQLAERRGADDPVRQAALDSVDPAATPGPAAYQALLDARRQVIEALADSPR